MQVPVAIKDVYSSFPDDTGDCDPQTFCKKNCNYAKKVALCSGRRSVRVFFLTPLINIHFSPPPPPSILDWVHNSVGDDMLQSLASPATGSPVDGDVTPWQAAGGRSEQ